jgi:hypothetical protein
VRLILPLAFAVLAGLASMSSADSASAVSACGRAGYSYAGFQAVGAARGVRAQVVALGNPVVANGHVAAWIGVGGPGQGAGGKDAWIQVGLSAFHETESRLYFETNRPGVGPRYTEVRSRVAPGSRHRMGIVEMRWRPSWWRVWVDGRPVSEPVYLPGSHARWQPIATAETWDGGRRVCNLFAYRFDRLAVVAPRSADWRRFASGHRFQDPGYRVLPSRTGFLARAVRPLPRGGPVAEKKVPAAEAASSAEDANWDSGADVPLEDENGAVGDPDATVGDGLP